MRENAGVRRILPIIRKCALGLLDVSFDYVSSDPVLSYQALPTSFEHTLYKTY